jgi:hypothetical protein
MTVAVALVMNREEAPTVPEALFMVKDMRQETGSVARAAIAFGLSPRLVWSWERGIREPSAPSRVLIWRTWLLAFCPENLIRLMVWLPRKRKNPIPLELARFAGNRKLAPAAARRQTCAANHPP